MNFFEKELRQIVGKQPSFADAKYIGRACYVSLDGGIKLKAQFVTHGTAYQYEAFKLTAINPAEGEIDSLLLLFTDYFGEKMVGGCKVTPYIWTYNGQTEWYREPDAPELAALGNAVQEYTELLSYQNKTDLTL